LEITTEQYAQIYPKLHAKQAVLAQWGKTSEYKCLEQLVQRESGWRITAHNKSSGAFGLFQFLPSTWGNYKFPYKPKEASIQITAGLRYITKRYGSPCKAWSFWQSNAAKGNPWY
jgi:SLT domain-containing protein